MTRPDPNAQPAIPGIRSATLNAHGDISPDDVARVTVFGLAHYVDREALAGTRSMLRQYRKDGALAGRFNARAKTWTPAEPIHRDNIGTPP